MPSFIFSVLILLPSIVSAWVRPTPTPPAIQDKLIATFSSYVGIKEEPMGSNNGFMVDKFNRSAGLEPFDHAPWCASVTNYGYKLNGLIGHGAYSPDWYSAKHEVSQQSVDKADIGLVWFIRKNRFAHTIAAVEKVTFSAGRAVQVTTLEGNTNKEGSREGD